MKELMISCILHLFFIAIFTDAERLDDYIHHYEKLTYSPHILHQRHLRAKRSLTDQSLVLRFKAYGKNFDLQLEKAKSIFTPDFKLQHRNGSKTAVDTSFIYEGTVSGKSRSAGSFVHGAIVEGVFRGFVVVPGDTTYHIEHSRRFFSDEKPFHSVIYSEKHMNMDPYKHKRPEGAGTCALEQYQDKMEEMAYRPLERHEQNIKATLREQEMEHYRNMYSREENTVHHDTRHGRRKRDTLGLQNTCYMYLRSDPVLWDLYKNKGVSDIVARDEILALFAAHVAAINKIYSETKFETYKNVTNGYFSYEGVHFQVQRTSIMTKESEKCDSILGATSYCNPNIDVSNFLNLNSLENHDEFCLAYVFTARDFTQGTLGLAWVGSYKNAAGGICEKYKQFPEGSAQVSKSLNTGIITLINYGREVAPRVSHLTFAHEVGHNFGSPHDSGDNCAPYGTGSPNAVKGNFIMYASATQGDLSNNNQFSDCSKDNISRVLRSIQNETNKKNCFKQSGVAFCGNGLVEEDEECDCGYLDDCKDQCCHAKQSGKTTPDDCKLRRDTNGNKYSCSPTQGPCCLSTCNFVPLSANQTCRVGTECVKRATCSGTSANCPAPDNYPDITTFCNSKSRVCKAGVCSESLCKRIGYESRGFSEYEECFGSTGSDNKEQMCYLSCQMKNSTDCISSADITDNSVHTNFQDLLMAINGRLDKIKLQAGSPCDNYRGYCDVFHKCRGIDNDGPLARLKNLIFNEKTLQKIKTWIMEYWWAVMMMALCLVVLMGLFIKICAVHTPSSNPKAKPALRITDTLPASPTSPPQQTYAQSSQPLQSYQQQSAPAGYVNAPQGPPPPYSASGGGPKRGHRPEEKKNLKKAKAMERKV